MDASNIVQFHSNYWCKCQMMNLKHMDETWEFGTDSIHDFNNDIKKICSSEWHKFGICHFCVPFAWYSLVKGERIVRFVLNMLWMTQMKQNIWMKFDDMVLMDEIDHIDLVVHMDEILAMWMRVMFINKFCFISLNYFKVVNFMHVMKFHPLVHLKSIAIS